MPESPDQPAAHPFILKHKPTGQWLRVTGESEFDHTADQGEASVFESDVQLSAANIDAEQYERVNIPPRRLPNIPNQTRFTLGAYVVFLRTWPACQMSAQQIKAYIEHVEAPIRGNRSDKKMGWSDMRKIVKKMAGDIDAELKRLAKEAGE